MTRAVLVGLASVLSQYGVMSMSSSSISFASTPAPLLMDRVAGLELRHDLAAEKLEPVHDVVVGRHARLIEQDDLIDVRLLPLA